MQNEKIRRITPTTIIVGIDVAKEILNEITNCNTSDI